jgi:hypothetical protein
MIVPPRNSWNIFELPLAKLDLTEIERDDQRIRNGCSILPKPQHSALGRYENSRELLMLSHVLRGCHPTRNFRVLVVPLKKTFSAEVKGLDGAMAGDVRWEGNL